MSTRVLIVGGGIGGLTAAIALRKAGCQVLVLERADELSAVGAGILLQENALSALKTIGIADDVSEAGVHVRGGEISTLSGRVIMELRWDGRSPLGVAIHRADLQRILADHVGLERVRTAAAVVRYALRDDKAVAVLATGEEIWGDVLVGADGIYSAVRRQHLDAGPPRYSGYTCWRGVTRHGDRFERGEVFEIWGAGRRFGGVHVDERLYWFAPVNAAPGGRDEPDRAKAALLELYRDWPERVLATIEATPESAILRNDIIDRPFRRDWGRGPVTLLGDAAHPMTPDRGQGAAQAIEDAVVLGRCMSAAANPVEALRRYERRRRARTRHFVRQSRMIGRMAQLESPAARWLRDTLMRATPQLVVRLDMKRTTRFSG